MALRSRAMALLWLGVLSAGGCQFAVPGIEAQVAAPTESGDGAGGYSDSSPQIISPPSAKGSVTGTSVGVSALGSENGTDAALIYTWSASPATVAFSTNETNNAKTTVATFSAAGTYLLEVTVENEEGRSDSKSFSLTVPQVLTSIRVTPQSASLASGATQAFAATAYDQFDQKLVTQPSSFSWSLTTLSGAAASAGGTFAANGTLTGGAVGSYLANARSGMVSGSTGVTVTQAVSPTDTAPTISTAVHAASNPITGTSVALSVLGADAEDAESALKYAWSADSNKVTFSASGTNAAKSTQATFTAAGSYSVTATVTDTGGKTASSTLAVTVSQTLTSVAVTPSGKSVTTGGTQKFSASALDQFKTSLSTQPSAFTWGLTTTGGAAASAGGSVASDGTFTAGSATGSYLVTAKTGAVSGQVGVTVTAPSTGGAVPSTAIQSSPYVQNYAPCDGDFDGDSPACPIDVELPVGGYSNGGITLNMKTQWSAHNYSGVMIKEIDPSKVTVDPSTLGPTFPDGEQSVGQSVWLPLQKSDGSFVGWTAQQTGPNLSALGWILPSPTTLSFTLDARFARVGPHTIYVWALGSPNGSGPYRYRLSDVPSVLKFTIPAGTP